MKEIFSFIGQFYIFGINAPWLLYAPLVIGAFLLMIHPFTGSDGYPRLVAFMFLGILPVYLYMKILGDLVVQSNTLSVIPLVWLAFMWLIAIAFKYNWIKTE